MRPVCVKCQCEMRCTKTGADIIVMSGGEPYQVWQADIFGCPGCGFEAVTGWASKPWLRREDHDFVEKFEFITENSERIEYVYERPTPKEKK